MHAICLNERYMSCLELGGEIIDNLFLISMKMGKIMYT